MSESRMHCIERKVQNSSLLGAAAAAIGGIGQAGSTYSARPGLQPELGRLGPQRRGQQVVTASGVEAAQAPGRCQVQATDLVQ